jgi:ribosomal protein L7/L12
MEPGYVVLVAVLPLMLFLLGIYIAALRALEGIQAHTTIVKRTEQKLDLLLQHAGVKFDPYANVPPEALEALRQRQKLKAIQLYCQKTGTGLKDAKDFVEELQRRSGLA